jgi:CubicO group peptidase (beta-lactamase class C family)
VTLLLSASLFLSSARAAAVWPTKGWTASRPDAEGLDAAVLSRLDEELASGRHGYVDGMLVIRNGKVIYEKSYKVDYDRLFASAPDRVPGPYNYYDPAWYPFEHGSDLHTMQSVSKSVTSALIGIAIRRGEIPGVNAKVLPYFAGYRIAPDPRRDRWTLVHFLTMTAGIRWDESTVPYTDSANSCARMEASKDWVQFVLDQPMAAEPGSTFVYSSGVTELLAQVLKKATGKHADAYAAEHLFGPLGISRFYWKHTPTGHPDTEGGLYLTPRDLAKIGYLYLKGGVWDGKRILPEGWVESSTAAHVDSSGEEAETKYGYQWWVLPGSTPAFAGIGYGGHLLVVVPSLDLIAVFTGWNVYEKPALTARFALDRVLEAVRKR